MGKLSFAEKLKALFGGKKVDDTFFDDLTDALVEGDLGVKTAFQLTEDLQEICAQKHLSDEADIRAELKAMLRGLTKSVELAPPPGKVSVYMLLGVNGVGKTTTAAKLARHFARTGNVILAAADTFRAAAEEQLEMHGARLGIRVVSHQHGSDPSSVVFDAADAARAKGGALVLADTAGRLHNKDNLVRELQKIDRIARKKADEGCYKKLLVIDATTGQNAVRQTEVFHEAVGVDAVVLTKYDSTAKGGVAFAVGKEFGIPVAFVCTGEGYDDIRPFDPVSYTDEFLG